MIQRKQTLFLLAAVIVMAVCLYRPLLAIEPTVIGPETLVCNMGVRIAGVSVSFLTWPLFATLSAAIVISLVTIFLYRFRKLQARLCLWAVFFQVIWYGYLALIYLGGVNLPVQVVHIRPCFAAALPLVSIILLFMARKGISDDEKLVRAADRVR